jgi:hypothetical protein
MYVLYGTYFLNFGWPDSLPFVGEGLGMGQLKVLFIKIGIIPDVELTLSI